MADPHWTSYLAIGVSIVALILSGMGYRRTGKVTEMERRLELRKAVIKAELDLSALEELLPRANKSRRHVAAALGTFRSGAMKIWQEQVTKDEETLKSLLASVPETGSDFVELDLKGLEAQLAGLHKLQLQIDQLTNKYKAAYAEDDSERDRIRNRHGG